MNKPTFEILKKIVNSRGKTLPVSYFTEKYDIGPRTFYNYIYEVNYYLDENGIKGSILIENEVLKTDIDQSSFPYLSGLMNSMSFIEYKLSNEERQNIIILILLSSNGAVKKQYFEDVLLVSRTSIINDIHAVKNFFSKVSSDIYNTPGFNFVCI